VVSVAFAPPALAAPHAQALALLLDATASAAELVRAGEADPALAGAWLHAGADHGSPLACAGDAAALLGPDAARRLLAAAALAAAFPGLAGAGIDADELWRHALMTALVAEAAAPDDAERARWFGAGLLHDAGRLALAAADPGRYARVVVLARAGLDPRELEHDLFGLDHAAAGAACLAAWGLPADIVAAAAGHHEGEGGALGEGVWRARHVATLLGLGDGVLPASVDLEREARSARTSALLQAVEWYRGAISGRG
jgi:putative nucleotidyltransferase with HDIG domain